MQKKMRQIQNNNLIKENAILSKKIEDYEKKRDSFISDIDRKLKEAYEQEKKLRNQYDNIKKEKNSHQIMIVQFLKENI